MANGRTVTMVKATGPELGFEIEPTSVPTPSGAGLPAVRIKVIARLFP